MSERENALFYIVVAVVLLSLWAYSLVGDFGGYMPFPKTCFDCSLNVTPPTIMTHISLCHTNSRIKCYMGARAVTVACRRHDNRQAWDTADRTWLTRTVDSAGTFNTHKVSAGHEEIDQRHGRTNGARFLEAHGFGLEFAFFRSHC
jgi:hypothetical protein